MSVKDTSARERVPVGDVVAGDWIVAPEEDSAEPEQLLWRSVQRTPNGSLRWSLKTATGLRHLDQDAWVYRLLSTEPPGTADTDGANDQVSLEVIHALDQERGAEASLIRAIVTGIAIAIPISMVIWVGLVVLAVGDKDPDWGPWLGMALGIGTLSGVYFGALAGFVAKAHVLDDVDRHAVRAVEAAAGLSPSDDLGSRDLAGRGSALRTE